jgi:NitT/TauT family transport system ATP-binding protein
MTVAGPPAVPALPAGELQSGMAPPDGETSNFVTLDRVSLRYGEEGTLALAEATLAVAQGEFVAVVGPSGCGKSSLMKVVTGLAPPSAGRVTVAGHPVAGPLSIVGMAFQNPTLLPWRTTLDNVMLPLEIAKPHCTRCAASGRPMRARRAISWR